MFAENSYKKPRKSRPDPFVLQKRAERILNTNPRQAYRLICQADRLEPRSKPIKRIKLQCLIKLNRADHALTLADKLVEISGRAIDYMHLAEVFHMRGELELAKNAAKQSLMLNENPTICALIARIYYTNGWYDTAEDFIRHAIELDTGKRFEDKNQIMLAHIKRKQHQYSQAIKILEAMRPGAQKWASVNLCKAFCFFEMKKYQTALAILLKLERSISRHQIDSTYDHRIRIYTGLIFIYERLYESGRIIEPYIKGIAQRAAQWLKNQTQSTLGEYQRHDFKNALHIIEELNIN